MIPFDPTRIEAKCEGRRILADVAGISLEDAAQYFTDATHKNFQSSFNAFTSAHPEAAMTISNHRPDGVGPGEMVAWFVFNNLTLGGRNAAMDLMVDGYPFAEAKAGRITKMNNTLNDFKIAKDNAPSVALALNDLVRFNNTYNSITGEDLPGWNGISTITYTVISQWKDFNLTELQKTAPKIKKRRYVAIDPDGNIFNQDETKIVGNIVDEDAASVLRRVIDEQPRLEVDPEIDTIAKISDRWKKQVFIDYVGGKNIALLDGATCQMVFFGEITDEMLELYRVHRNQPWARIHLDRI